MSQVHADIEAAIRAAPRWAVLRAGYLMGNALGWADELRATGELRWPFPQGGRTLPGATSRAGSAIIRPVPTAHTGGAA